MFSKYLEFVKGEKNGEAANFSSDAESTTVWVRIPLFLSEN